MKAKNYWQYKERRETIMKSVNLIFGSLDKTAKSS